MKPYDLASQLAGRTKRDRAHLAALDRIRTLESQVARLTGTIRDLNEVSARDRKTALEALRDMAPAKNQLAQIAHECDSLRAQLAAAIRALKETNA